MKVVNVILTHPIIFLFDTRNERMSVPTYNPDSTVSFNESCVSIISGCGCEEKLEIKLEYNGYADFTLKKVFDGFIETPSRKISVVTSLNETLMELELKTYVSRVNIYVDDGDCPSKIFVNVE
jgi:hypothetical protein